VSGSGSLCLVRVFGVRIRVGGALQAPAASRCSVRKLTARSFRGDPPLKGLRPWRNSRATRRAGPLRFLCCHCQRIDVHARVSRTRVRCGSMLSPARRFVQLVAFDSLRVVPSALTYLGLFASASHAVLAVARAEAPSAGGRRGKERAVSLRTEQRLRRGPARLPRPEHA